MGKVLCFIYDKMADFELTFPCTAVGLWMQKELVMIAYEKKTVTSEPGLQYIPHMTVKEALDLEEVEGLIIPGGWNDEQRPELTELIQNLHNDGKFLAAICAGPQYLARAGILKDRNYTTTLTPQALKEQGKTDFFPRENFINERVVRDDNVITAVGSAFIDFAIEIADWYGAFDDPETKITKEALANSYKGI